MAKPKLFSFLDPKSLVLAAAFGLVGIGTIGIVILTQQAYQDEESWQPTQATIVRFGGVEGKWNVGRIIVTAQTSDGLTAQANARLHQVKGCTVGDSVPAIRNGKSLKLKPRPC